MNKYIFSRTFLFFSGFFLGCIFCNSKQIFLKKLNKKKIRKINLNNKLLVTDYNPKISIPRTIIHDSLFLPIKPIYGLFKGDSDSKTDLVVYNFKNKQLIPYQKNVDIEWIVI